MHPPQVFMKTASTQHVSLAQGRDSSPAEQRITGVVEKVTEGGYLNPSESPQDMPSVARIAQNLELPPDGKVLERVLVDEVLRGADFAPPVKCAVARQNTETPSPTYQHSEVPTPIDVPPSLNEDSATPPANPIRDETTGTRVGHYVQEIPDSEHPPVRSELLSILATTDSVSRAWDAYQNLMALPRDGSRLQIPWSHLHRLSRLIASTKPRTRTLFIRLLTVISTIHKTGGRVSLWQWNALIDFAGKGWRKSRQEDFKNAMGVFNDLVTHRPPGATFTRSGLDTPASEGNSTKSTERPTPDVVTYTTLLNIAGRTLDPPTFHHASVMFDHSGILPNRITLLSKLRYFSRRGELSGVRATISQLRQNGFDLGLDGTNACIWAYARNERLDVASAIYEVLKSRLWNPQGEQDENIVAFKTFLDSHEGIKVPDNILPDRITFTALLQSFAYHGDLMQSLQVFMDMITFMNGASGADSDGERVKLSQTIYMLPAYRAIFLGFVRHAKSAKDIESEKKLSKRLKAIHLGTSVEYSAWSLEALEALFNDFLGLPEDAQPSERMLYWILMAFARCTGDDAQKLREVFTQLEERFGGGWGGRLARLRKRLFSGG